MFLPLVAALATIPRLAHADASSAAAAQALFDDARRLLREGQVSEACSKLDESQRIDPGLGTALNLAACWERLGRTASAWALFREVEAGARRAAQVTRASEAAQRASALEPRLGRLTIVVDPCVEGIEVLRDGERVGAAQLGVAVPVDPGEHVVTGRTEGKTTFERRIVVDAAGSTVTVRITLPTPNDARAPEAPIAPPGPRGSRGWALAATGLGVLGLGAGATLGLFARARYDDSRRYCDGNACEQPGLDMRSDARGLGNAATVAFAAGLAFGGAAAVLWIAAPGGRAKPVSMVPQVRSDGVGVAAGGSF